MAEKTGDMNDREGLDAASAVAGAGSDAALEKSAVDFPETRERGSDSDAGMIEHPSDTEQLKARIEETRNQMGETIDAIQDRLSFANISEQVSETVGNAIETAKDTAYEATIGKAVNFMKNVGDGVTHSGAFRTMRDNPFPLALIGLGAGLLMYQSFSGRRSGVSRPGNGRDRARSYGDADRELKFGSARRAVSDVTGQAYEGLTDKASDAMGSITNVAGTAYEGVAGAMSNAYTGAGELAHRAYDRAGEFGSLAHEKYDEYLEENPLALGAVALAVGAAVGFAIPSTEFEGRLMGEARENLVQRAQDAAGSMIDRAKHAAAEAGQTIKQEAQSLTE